MTAAELRGLVADGPAVVMVAKDDMLKLLDERDRLRASMERLANGLPWVGSQALIAYAKFALENPA